jgi:hypothetical protein
MCTRINWNDEKPIFTQGELLEEVGEILLEEGVAEKARDDETCLCPVNIPVTLEKAGCEYQYDRAWDEYSVSP